MPFFFQSVIYIAGSNSKDYIGLIRIHISTGMAPLTKFKVISKVKGQFGTANQPKRPIPGGLINKVDTATLDIFSRCSSLLFNRKVNFSKGQGHFGSYDSLLCYL